MSQENLKKFYEELKANKAFADELNAFMKAEKAETAEQTKTAMVNFASQKDFAFTAEEFDAFAKENQVLSDADLDAVSGGRKRPHHDQDKTPTTQPVTRCDERVSMVFLCVKYGGNS